VKFLKVLNENFSFSFSGEFSTFIFFYFQLSKKSETKKKEEESLMSPTSKIEAKAFFFVFFHFKVCVPYYTLWQRNSFKITQGKIFFLKHFYKKIKSFGLKFKSNNDFKLFLVGFDAYF
jgi:hypothetical protein